MKIFSHELFLEHHSDFLEFLRNLLKDRPYVALAYMTGVLPIKKYSTGSALNMFKEYTMLKAPFFEEYFGFTEDEVKALCDKQSAMIIYGLLSYHDGSLCIPNKELMLEFEAALEDEDFGYVAELVHNSGEIKSSFGRNGSVSSIV